MSNIRKQSLGPLDSTVQSGHLFSPSAPSSNTPDGASLLRLPPEVLEKICNHLDPNDLAKVAQVCHAFRELAAVVLYRQVSHIFYPDAMDALFSEEHFTAIMETLKNSTYNYSRHVREVTIMTTYLRELAGWPETDARYQEWPDRYVKGVNKYLTCILTRMTGLGSFKWDIKVEVVRPIFVALSHLKNLQSLHIRLPVNGIYRGQNHLTYHTLHEASTLNDQREFAKELRTLTQYLPGDSSFSLIKGLRDLAILDIPSLTYIPEVARCISSSSSTLRTLQLSFNDKVAVKTPGRNGSFDVNRDSFDFSDLFEPNILGNEGCAHESDLDDWVKTELSTQQKALAFLFGLGFSTGEPTRKKHTDLRGPVSKKPAGATGGSNSVSLTPALRYQHPTSRKSYHVNAAVSVAESSMASTEPASFGIAMASNPARDSMSSVEDLKQLCETLRQERASHDFKGKGKAQPATIVEEIEDEKESKKRYLRANFGLPVEGLYIYQIPVTASVLTRGIEISSLKHLSLLNVGPQEQIWEAMGKHHAQSPCKLTSIHTDHVTWSFLEFAQGLSKLIELFILERHPRSKLLNMTERTTVGIELICRTVLEKHIDHLERLVIRHDDSALWSLDPNTAMLLTSSTKLVELAVGINPSSYPFLIHCIGLMKSLKALQVFWYWSPSSVSRLQESLASFVDHILCYPDLQIEFVGMAYIHHGPVRNIIIDLAARRTWLETLRNRNFAANESQEYLVAQTDPWHREHSSLEYSGAVGLGDIQIAQVKMWEPRIWYWKL